MAAAMKKPASFAGFRLAMTTLSAEGPAGSPSAPTGNSPDTVFLEDLTWPEIRDGIQGGTTGPERKGP